MWSYNGRVFKTEDNIVNIKPFNISDMHSEEEQKEINQENEMFKIKEEAYEQGFRDGLDTGRLQILKEIEGQLFLIQSLIKEIGDERKKIYRQIEIDIVNLALAIAKKVIYTVTDHESDIALRVTREAIKRLIDKEVVKVKVNPEDFEILNSQKMDIVKTDGIKDLIIEPDESIHKGGCVIETKYGDIDGRIESQIDVIESELKKELQDNDRS